MVVITSYVYYVIHCTCYRRGKGEEKDGKKDSESARRTFGTDGGFQNSKRWHSVPGC